MPRPRRSMPADFPEIMNRGLSWAKLKKLYHAGGSTVSRWKREFIQGGRERAISNRKCSENTKDGEQRTPV